VAEGVLSLVIPTSSLISGRYQQLFITFVKTGFITTVNILLFFNIPGLILIHQVSDKRLLERCGEGESYLNETRSISVRPSGLHIKRAED
jgi:hypothetical protein